MNFYIKHFKGIVSEGGGVRNEAFYQYFRHRSDVTIFDLAATNVFHRMAKTLRFVFYFGFRRNHHIYMNFAAIFVLFPTFLFRTAISGLIFKLLDRLSKRHVLHVEINDLPFEQSLDLELPNFSYYQSFQRNLFKLNKVKFDFASYSMRSYAIEKYHLEAEQTNVIINGAYQLKDFDGSKYDTLFGKKSEKLKYVYVGTLNKGRQIENLIQVFRQSPHELILLGPGGEWITQMLEDYKIDHIRYLGVFSDFVALQISSLCDVGVIPYDESRFYYNICYPTKVSFYLAAGLPILSTRLQETQQALRGKEVAWFSPIDTWEEAIVNVKKEDIEALRKNVLLFRPQFYWCSLLEGLNF